MAKVSYSHADLEALWVLAGGTPQSADTAAAIAQAESGGCLYAKAGPTDDRPVKTCTYRRTTRENSYGLWQVNRMAHPQYLAAQLWQALGNAQAAVEISGGGADFRPWTTYKSGAYKQYLVAGAGGPPPGATAPPSSTANDATRALSGWHSLQVALARQLPTALHRSAALRRASLRRLGR